MLHNINFKSTYMYQDLLHQVAVQLLTEEQPKPDDACLCSDAPSDELLYEATAWFTDEELRGQDKYQ